MEVAIQEQLEPRLEADGEFDASVYQLLRHYARTKRLDAELTHGLRAAGVDLQETLARGLIAEAAVAPEETTYATILRAQPELWWLDLELGIHGTAALAELLSDELLHELRSDSLDLCRQLDRGTRPAAWEAAADVFASLVGDDVDGVDAEAGADRYRVLARGVGLSIDLSPDWLGPALLLVDGEPSRGLLRAMARDAVLLGQDRWIGALLLRGGPRAVALGTASLLFAPPETLTRTRNLLSMAPATTMVRVAEAHGLLTLAGAEGLEVAETLRTAFLAQAWQGHDLVGLPWWKAFRGEQLVSRSLPELDSMAYDLARDVCLGLVHHLDDEATGSDPARREALGTCLAWLLRKEPRYDAALRIAEARIREIGRQSGSQQQAAATRAHAMVLLASARCLLRREGGRERARGLYARILRLRKANPEMLPRDVFPDTLDSALHISDPDRAARRWLTRELAPDAELVGPALPPSAEDPLPAADEIVATAEGRMPLPTPLGSWVGARRRSLLVALVGSLVPLPFRHLFALVARFFGCTPQARFVLGEAGTGAMVRAGRCLGIRMCASKRTIAGGCLFTFPEGSAKADRMLARWAAILILASTTGTWVIVSESSLAVAGLSGVSLGAVLLAVGLCGYVGALLLHRTASAGLAVAVQEENGRVSVWSIDAETRYMLQQIAAPVQPGGVVELSPPHSAPQPDDRPGLDAGPPTGAPIFQMS